MASWFDSEKGFRGSGEEERPVDDRHVGEKERLS